MINIRQVADVYAAAESVATEPGALELVVVADDAGARVDAAVRALTRGTADDDLDLWADFLRMGTALRWRLMTEPFPESCCPGRAELLLAMHGRAQDLTLMTDAATGRLVNELATAAAATIETASIAQVLRETLSELDPADSILVVEGGRACAAARTWMVEQGLGHEVMTSRDHLRSPVVQKAVCVGAPNVFPVGLVTAPHARELTFVLPSWRSNRGVPSSHFSDFAEGVRQPRPKTFKVGEQAIVDTGPNEDDDVRPEVFWTPRQDGATQGPDMVLANKVLLAGSLATYLDRDGELIRTLDPDQPAGERVELRPVERVAPGTYLVLRQGETESEALLKRAKELLGDAAVGVSHSQERWKQELQTRIEPMSRNEVANQLRALGVVAFNQAPTWVRSTVVRPRRQADFLLLLKWLGLDPGVYAVNARRLIRARSLAVAEVRSALEDAVAETDISNLQRDGYVRIDSHNTGFAGMVAARVLSISPYEEQVHHTQIRAILEDGTGKWLE
jgi:sarcosine oxidase gamma subunit